MSHLKTRSEHLQLWCFYLIYFTHRYYRFLLRLFAVYSFFSLIEILFDHQYQLNFERLKQGFMHHSFNVGGPMKKECCTNLHQALRESLD